MQFPWGGGAVVQLGTSNRSVIIITLSHCSQPLARKDRPFFHRRELKSSRFLPRTSRRCPRLRQLCGPCLWRFVLVGSIFLLVSTFYSPHFFHRFLEKRIHLIFFNLCHHFYTPSILSSPAFSLSQRSITLVINPLSLCWLSPPPGVVQTLSPFEGSNMQWPLYLWPTIYGEGKGRGNPNIFEYSIFYSRFLGHLLRSLWSLRHKGTVPCSHLWALCRGWTISSTHQQCASLIFDQFLMVFFRVSQFMVEKSLHFFFKCLHIGEFLFIMAYLFG